MMKYLLIALTAWPLLALADEPPAPRIVISANRDQEWASYRHAYTAGAFFARYTKTRPLIQAHMQVRPLKPDAPLDGLEIHLTGEKTDIVIPVDTMGRATVPLLKQAYDEDAVLHLNRQRGHYYFSGRYSIKERADGSYPVAELRAACEQMIDAQRSSGYRFRLFGKKCAGVKFVYAVNDTDASAQFLREGAASQPLPAAEGPPFEDRSMGTYKVATYRFADWPETGTITTGSKLLAIGTLYE
jgi:hypothetical protein